MNPLNSDQKQLIFDYCFGLTSPEQTKEAETLISSNKQAAEIHAKIKTSLEPLNSIKPESCPDSLSDGTVWQLISTANSSQNQLQKLLASEQKRESNAKNPLRIGFARRLATAAVLMIVGSLLVTTFKAVSGYTRYHSMLNQCQMQQSSIFQGLHNYISDHDGQPPSVATAAGDPWWKVGHQGEENHSNTRRIFLLVKEGYVKPAYFICPACGYSKAIQMTPAQLSKFKDFPSRRYITYSFQINCRRTSNGKLLCRKVIMADWNPLFEKLPDDYSKELNLRLNKKLLSLNSSNHNRRGQNVLFGDGSVEFRRTRFIGTDDIFTLRDTDVYQGCESPSCETDFFLAP
jgi:prepilin-type processing-associated H-X9-DG protein